jgi:hypothetical protein
MASCKALICRVPEEMGKTKGSGWVMLAAGGLPIREIVLGHVAKRLVAPKARRLREQRDKARLVWIQQLERLELRISRPNH